MGASVGLDSLDDDDDDAEAGDAGETIKHTPRTPKHIVARESLPSVETSLDRFIEKANEQLLDVSGFQPASKEPEPEHAAHALQREIAALKAKLAAAEARAVEPVHSSPWGKVLAGFVVGCATTAAVMLVLPKSSPSPQATEAQHAPQGSAVSTTQPPVVATPIETPPTPPTAPPPQPAAAPAAPAAASAPAAAVPATPAAAAPDPVTAKKRPGKRTAPPTKTDNPASPPTQPAKGSGEGSDLFNPF
jgi:hypothetical protein